MTLFFIIVLLVLSAGYAFVGFRLIVPSHLPAPWGTVAWIGLLLCIVLPLGYSLLGRQAEGDWTEPLAWVAYTALGLLSFIVTFLLIRDLLWLGFLGVEQLAALFHSGPFLTPEGKSALIRFSGFIVVGLSLVLTPYGLYQARRTPDVVTMTVSLKNLPLEMNGLRIVQITDLHAGLTIRRAWFERLVGQVNRLDPDVIVCTGDLADGSVAALRKDTEPLADLRAPRGKFFVTGNHEYYSGVEAWVEEIRRLGFTPLMNEHFVLGTDSAGLVMAGVTDHSAGGFRPETASNPDLALRGVPEGLPIVLLAHQPRVLSLPGAARADLILSGHTHGGQFFPWNFFARLGQPAISGLNRIGSSLLFVNSGTGYWGPPVRLGAPPQIAVVVLKRAS